MITVSKKNGHLKSGRPSRDNCSASTTAIKLLVILGWFPRSHAPAWERLQSQYKTTKCLISFIF